MASNAKNTIVFDFESIVDCEIGAIKFLKYHQDELTQSMISKLNLERLNTTEESSYNNMQIKEYNENGLSALSYVFKDPINVPILYDGLKTQYEKMVLYNSGLTGAYNLLITYSSVAITSGISSIISCRTPTQFEVATKIFGTYGEVIESERVKKREYSRLVLGDIRLLDYYKPEGKSILVLDYRKNFTEGDYGQLIPEYIVEYGDVNIFDIANSYVGITSSLG